MMGGINSNPFGNLSGGLSGGVNSGLSGGLSSQVGGSSGGQDGGGIVPNQQPSAADGASFGDTLKDMIIARPSQAQNSADALAAREAAYHDVDPQDLAIATAKAGIEIQMSTRTISQAVQGIRTLFQMQI